MIVPMRTDEADIYYGWPRPSDRFGAIGSWQAHPPGEEPEEKPSRPIGFRMPAPEELPPSPDWMLL